jgi:aerobic carbon-monoxide dehydrogenase medium subunit
MKPPPFTYARPTSVDDAVGLLTGDDVRVLAGGQSLVPLLNFRLGRPETLVDIMRIDELATLEERSGSLVIGAAVSQREVERSPLVQTACPLLVEALRQVGHLQTRGRGTVVGSLAHADPAAELPAVAITLGALLVARSARGIRTVPAADFFRGPYMTTLAPDELVAEVHFPLAPWTHTSIREVARRQGDFALAGVVAAVRLADEDGGRVFEALRLTAFAHAGRPVALERPAETVRGRRVSAATCAEATRAAVDELAVAGEPTRDERYRRAALGALIQRTLNEVPE